MTDVNKLITDNIDVWTSAIKNRKTQGRGTNSKTELAGIKKLRALILELAVNGKLVPQNTSDESASILLEKISEEKAQLIADKKIKKQKVLPAISLDEIPFEVPVGWEWSKLGDLIYRISNGFSGKQNKDGEGYPLTRIETISNSNINIDKLGYSPSIPDEKLEYYKLLKNDILLSHINSDYHVGKTAIYSSDKTIYHGVNLILIRLSPLMSPLFCDLVINQLRLSGYFLSIAQHAIGQSSINQTKIIDIPIPSPPLAEQHRIVAKVDELMALCDQLEQQTEESLAAHQTLVEVLLAALTNCDSTEDFQTSWQRIAEHFDVMFTTELSIEKLKQTILQLAVMGKLVPQNPNDEPASVLLEKIAEEKAQLIAVKKIKKQKPLPAITDEEKPFELPNGWELCRLGAIGYDLGGGTPSKSKPEYWNGDIPWVSPKDMKVTHISSSQDYVTQQAISGSSAKTIPVGSLLMVVRGMILAHSFPVAITTVPVVINQDMKALVFSNVEQSFLLLMMQSFKNIVVNLVDRSSHGTCKLVSDKLWSKVILIPPLAEQHRIVAKVDELMALCEQLKTRLSDAQTTQLHLADAVVENALS